MSSCNSTASHPTPAGTRTVLLQTTPVLVALEGLVVLVEQARSRVEAWRGSGLDRFLAKYVSDRADDQAALIAYSALQSMTMPLVRLVVLLLPWSRRLDPIDSVRTWHSC